MSLLTNLVAYWKGDSLSGGNVPDSVAAYNLTHYTDNSGNGDGTIQVSAGLLNNAVDNTGVDTGSGNGDPLSVSDATFERSTFSLALWFKGTTIGDLAREGANFDTGSNWSLSGSSPTFDTASSGTAINDGNWHHIVAVATGSQSKIYVDGVLKDTQTEGALTGAGTALYLLGWVDGSNNVKNTTIGLLDETSYYSRAITGGEVELLYAAGAPFSYDVFANLPIFDAASNSGYQAASSSYSWSHTCTGTDRFLAVDVSLLSVAGTSVSSITYNGVNLTKIGSQSSVSGADRVECWGLANPASGTNTIAVTLSAGIVSAACAVSYENVKQSQPWEAFAGAQATNVGAADATVTITPTADYARIHAAIATNDGSLAAGNISRNSVSGAGGSGGNEDTLPIHPAAGTAIKYSSVGALKTWAIAGYVIRPVNAADSYTLTGPGSGTVNVASTNFTVTPNGNSSVTVTPASTGAGSFTPSTVTFDGTNAAKTFTYTPTSTTGSPHTISVTNSGSLTDPGSLSYTVNPPPSALTPFGPEHRPQQQALLAR